LAGNGAPHTLAPFDSQTNRAATVSEGLLRELKTARDARVSPKTPYTPKLVARLRTANHTRLFDVEAIRIDGDSQELPFEGYEPGQDYEQ
jgi:hypothetical protein